ncbi:MAG: hypothetical protein KDK97_09325 [Verrucomicrobiales bacterium]|nr:hypothetical protein [Verrucomicrobiales bacterium]MCP5558911.1 hypothetical protein [Verrucomicrobiaceae bacterium]
MMTINDLSIEEIKARLDIPTVWRLLALPGEPGKSIASPFREDRKPSFSVFDNGRRYRDHSTGDAGTVVDFVALALDLPLGDAVKWARAHCGGAVVPVPMAAPTYRAKAGGGVGEKGRAIPRLRLSRADELEALAALRGIKVETLKAAESCGLLMFTEWAGRVAWCVCDPGGRIAEGRRLDGRVWEAYKTLPARKCHAWGGGKDWPVNLEAAARCEKLLLVEGGPDVLAALEIVRREGVEGSVGVAGILGAGNTRLDPAALPFFRGKAVRLFPHADEAGRNAARAWARLLRDAGAARVDAFDLSGLIRADGEQGKDVCDVLNIAPECQAEKVKFQGRMTP